MKNDELANLYAKYDLTDADVFEHKHYKIITRQGIDKIQAKEKIFIEYDAIRVEPDFCVIKATAEKGDAKIQTFGSAKYGDKTWDKTMKGGNGGWNESGNTTTWYIAEMAEKRAMSRAVLKLTGFYELGVFGEDESEDFKKKETPNPEPPKQVSQEVKPPQRKLDAEAISRLPETTDIVKLQYVLRNYMLTTFEKKEIEKRIKEIEAELSEEENKKRTLNP